MGDKIYDCKYLFKNARTPSGIIDNRSDLTYVILGDKKLILIPYLDNTEICGLLSSISGYEVNFRIRREEFLILNGNANFIWILMLRFLPIYFISRM